MRFAMTIPMLALATAAVAQDAQPQRATVSNTCRAEIFKLCPPSGDRAAMGQCISASLGKFTDSCKSEMMKVRADRDKMRAERRGGMTPAPGGDKATSTPSADKPK